MRFIFLFLSIQLFSQTKKLDTVFCDCHLAREVILEDDKKIGKTLASPGFGFVREIREKTRYSFEEEHHTAWYKLIINSSGKLTFDIIPENHCDDYDFMLFNASSIYFCDSLANYTIKPVRSCISRNKEELRGRTGLNNKATEEFIKAGIASAYCKPLEVQKGNVYYLVLDNVYDGGSGHSIEFSINNDIIISGVIMDDNKKTIKAEVSLTNFKGDTLFIGKTKKDGSYDISALVSKKQTYLLNFYNDSSFAYSKSISIKDTTRLKLLSTVLPKLRKGKKYSVGTINFIGGTVQYLPRAIPTLNNLTRLMRKNKTLKIRIIGHSNGRFGFDTETEVIAFTKGRATSVKNYLVLNGIDEARIEIDGRGDHEMLYHEPKNPDQLEQNRRVEILVLDF